MSSRTQPLRRSPRFASSSPEPSPDRSRSNLTDSSFTSPRNTSLNRVTRERTPDDDDNEDQVDSSYDGHYVDQQSGLNDSADTLLVDVDGNDSPRKPRGARSPAAAPPLHKGVTSPGADGLARLTYTSPRRRVGVGAVLQERSPGSPRRKAASPKKPPHGEERMSKLDLCIFCVVIVTVVLLYLYLWPFYNSQTQNPSQNNVEVLVKNFESGLKNLTTKFPSQNRRLWTGLLAVAKPILQDSPPLQPAVTILAFVDTPDGNDVGRIVSSEYINLLSAIYTQQSSVVSITRHLTDLKTKDQLKLLIDDELKKHLTAGSKVVFVPNLDKMNGEAAKIFYGFCDNENAPFKQAHFVFTVGLPREDLYDGEMVDDRVEKVLSENWDELDQDMFSALWSRIGNNVLMVEEETETAVMNQSQTLD